MTDDDRELCGAETTKGTPCQNYAESCPWDHGGENNTGRPKIFADEDGERKQDLVLTAVRAGLNISDQAAHAKVNERTLRRRLCCIETPREPTLTTDDPCEFCQSYARAHSDGAIAVLEECKPEFRAAASFGYTDKHEIEHSGEIDGFNFTVNASDDS